MPFFTVTIVGAREVGRTVYVHSDDQQAALAFALRDSETRAEDVALAIISAGDEARLHAKIVVAAGHAPLNALMTEQAPAL